MNRQVEVRLTEAGKLQQKKWFDSLGLEQYGFSPEAFLDSGSEPEWYRYSLWELMQVYGSACSNGGLICFVDNQVRIIGASQTGTEADHEKTGASDAS